MGHVVRGVVGAFIVVAVATQPLSAQGFGVTVGPGWLSPDGEIRLVRGDRKVVTNQIDAGAVLDARAELRLGRRWGGSASLVVGGFDHHHVETFTEGEVLSSVNSLRYVAVLLGPTLTVLERNPARLSVGAQFSYNRYTGDFVITGETVLPPGGVGPPNVSQRRWALRNDFRGGLSLVLDLSLSNRMAVSLTGRRIVTDFGADIVNDPEDDGQDIDLDFDPLGVALGLRLTLPN